MGRKIFAQKLAFLLAFVFCFGTGLKAEAQVWQDWIARFDDGGNEHAQVANDIAIDSGGNIYITGFSTVVEPWEYDLIALKYNPDGNLLWPQSYDGANHSSDEGKFIVLDSDNNAYILGTSKRTNSCIDFIILKFNPDGVRQWIEIYSNPPSGETSIAGIGLDADRNVYVVGSVP
jgi:hypothetical protein